MSEEGFQGALIHLYSHIDRLQAYSDAFFEDFPLTDAERLSLKELIRDQRGGLLIFNQLLHSKRSRSISQTLPQSSRLVPEQLDALLRDFAGPPVTEGATDSTAAVRSFAAYVGAGLAAERLLSRAAEVVWFEAMCASVTAPTGWSDTVCRAAAELSCDLRLAGSSAAVLLSCRFDVPAALAGSAPLDSAEIPWHPCSFFAFPADGQVRVMAVGTGLASAIERLQAGQTIGAILASLPDEARRVAVEESLHRLLSMGAPFVPGKESNPR